MMILPNQIHKRLTHFINMLILLITNISKKLFDYFSAPITLKKVIVLIVSFLVFCTLSIIYLARINFYEPLEIKITHNSNNIASNVIITGTKPIAGEDTIKYDNTSESWKFKKGYFRKIIIHLLPSNPEITKIHIRIKTNDNIEIYNDTKTVINNKIELINIASGNTLNKFIYVAKTNIENFQYAFLILLVTTIIYILSKTKKTIIYILSKTKKTTIYKTTIFNKTMLIGILFYGIICLIIPAFYCFPNVEEFSLVVMAKKGSILSGIMHPLVTTDGRYFTSLLHSISPLAWGEIKSYKYAIFFSIILTYFSHFLFIHSFSIFPKKNIRFFLFPSIFIFSHFAIIPSIVHELYWMSSSFVYLWSWNFFLIWFSLLWVMLKTNNPFKKLFYFILSFTILICSYGLTEMMIIVNLVAIFCYLIYVFKTKKSQLIHLIPFAIISIVCIYILISSPGNKFRLESTDVTRDFEYYTNVLVKGSTYIFSTAHGWLLNNTLIIPFAIIISYLFIDNTVKISNKALILIIFVLLSLIYILPFVSFISIGVSSAERIFNFTNWFFLVILFLLIPLLITNNIEAIKQKALKAKPILINLNILLIIAYLTFSSNNFGLILHEFVSGEYKEYKKEMENRYQIIEIAKQNKNWSSATIDTLIHKPITIYFDDVVANKTSKLWNTSYESYFNIDELIIKNDTIFKINTIKNVKK